MTRSKKKVLCIFCNERGPKATEDIIPRWLADLLGGVGPITTTYMTDIPGRPVTKRSRPFGNLATLKLKNVCVECNGGWMRRLEDSCNPILTPLILGSTSALGQSAQRRIAAWAQLKCLSLDAYYLDTHDGSRHLPASLAHEFCRTRQPLLNSVAAVGRYRPPREGVLLPWGRYMVTTPATVEHPEMDTVTVTFGFGHLVIQAIIGAWRDDFATPARFPATDPRLILCWPVKFDGHLIWPPVGIITPEDFLLVAGPGTRIDQPY